MKLKLPTTCQGFELDDREKVIANLMLNIAYIDYKQTDERAYTGWKDTEYYFYKKDLGRIMNTESLTSSYSTLREIFYIGQLNEFTISMRFIKAENKYGGSPDFYFDELTEEKYIRLHYYLMGRLSYPEGVIEEDGQINISHPIRKNAYANDEI